MQTAISKLPPRLERLRWNQDLADVAIAMAAVCLAFATAIGAKHPLTFVSIPLLLLQTAPIAVRRRNPMRVLIVTGVAIIAYSLLGYPESNGWLGVFIAFYTVAAHESRRRALVAAIVTAGGILVSFVSYGLFESLTGWTTGLATTFLSFGLAWVIGDNLRVRRAYTRQLEERARVLEREREERATLAVAQERGRIARELHDVVAHHVSVMVVQSAAARRVFEKDPGLALEALEAVETSGRTALAEMRRMLEVLRAETNGVGPQPGLADLDRLIGQVRDIGLPVEISITGTPCAIPAGMDLAAYRIIQEALTNAVKHAGKATAKVLVAYGCDTLDIEITDDGRGAAAALLAGPLEGGHGLIGMQERVALYDGTLETGPLFPGGYRVHAHFPLEPEPTGSRSDCCDQESALSQVASEARKARDREARNVVAQHHAEASLVAARVMPPIIGRVVPPHPQPESRHRPASGPRKRQTQSGPAAQPVETDQPPMRDEK
jgi:signal transduction histidine kinase